MDPVLQYNGNEEERYSAESPQMRRIMMFAPDVCDEGDGEHRCKIADAYEHLYQHALKKYVPSSYPDVGRSLWSITDNSKGQSVVFRYSEYTKSLACTGVGDGWVPIRDHHCWGMDTFHTVPCDHYCIICDELRDRFINWYSGRYDYLDQQVQHHELYNFNSLGALDIEIRRPSYNRQSSGWSGIDWTDGSVVGSEEEFLAPAEAGIKFIHSDTSYCAVCQEECKTMDLRVMIDCGHSYCTSCFYQLSNSVCPLCRTRFDVDLVAESGVIENRVPPNIVEYCATDVLGNVEFDDPIGFDQIVHRDGKYQLYIVTLGLGEGEIFEVKGPILQVKQLVTGTRLINQCTSYKYDHSGSMELEIVAEKPVVMTIVKNQCQGRVLMMAMGTYGDVQPHILLRDEFRYMGMEAKIYGPDTFKVDYGYDWKSIEPIYLASPTVLPSFDMVKKFPVLMGIYKHMLEVVAEYKPDCIVASSMMLGVAHLASRCQIPLVYISSIPMDRGAHVYMEQKSEFATNVAKVLERFLVSARDLPAILSDLGENGKLMQPNRDIPVVYTIAPELYSEGSGNLVLQAPTTDRYTQYDVYFGLGSMVSKEVEDQYIDWFRTTEHKVLFLTKFTRLNEKNITYVSQLNHEDVFRDIPVVVCHGGSGTIQTALRHGCKVLVHPFWADQKYWPTMLRYQAIAFCSTDKNIFLGQLKAARSEVRLTSIGIRSLAKAILSKIEYVPKQVGTFIYSRKLDRLSWLNKIEELSFGDSRSEHVGIGHLDSDGKTRYVEVNYTGVMSVDCYDGEGIDPSINFVKFLDIVYDEKLFESLMVQQYSLFSNCRCVVDRYLEVTGGKYSLTRWHEDRKGIQSSVFFGKLKRKRERTDQRIELTHGVAYLDYPHTVYDPPRDGYCLYTCIDRFMKYRVDRAHILRCINECRAELSLDHLMVLPTYSEDNGDLVLHGIVRACDIRAAVMVDALQRTVIVNGLAGGSTVYLRLVDNHYQLYEFKVPAIGYEYTVTDTDYEVPFPSNNNSFATDNGKDQLLDGWVTELETEMNLTDGVVMDGGCMDMVLNYQNRYVLKLTYNRINTPFLREWIKEGGARRAYAYLMDFMYDDGLPVIHKHIRWPKDLVWSNDYHRNNFRSFNGRAVPIDQYCSKANSKLHRLVRYGTRNVSR